MAAEGNVARGVALVVAATLAFAGADVLSKSLAAHYPIPLIMVIRNLVNLGLLAVILGPRHGAGLWRVQRFWLVTLRALSLVAGSLTMGLALRVMPVGETVAFVYLSPFLVMILAGPLLGEKVAGIAWVLAAIGFLGVVLIARPGGGLDPFGVAMAATNALCATAYHLLTRVLTRTETTVALMFHTAVVGVLAFAALTLVAGDEAVPGAADLGRMAALGVLATAGHFLFTSAYREAPASLLAPVNYLHLVWAGVLGFIVFGHVPDHLAALGMVLVVVSGVTLALQARRQHRAAVAEIAEA